MPCPLCALASVDANRWGSGLSRPMCEERSIDETVTTWECADADGIYWASFCRVLDASGESWFTMSRSKGSHCCCLSSSSRRMPRSSHPARGRSAAFPDLGICIVVAVEISSSHLVPNGIFSCSLPFPNPAFHPSCSSRPGFASRTVACGAARCIRCSWLVPEFLLPRICRCDV